MVAVESPWSRGDRSSQESRAVRLYLPFCPDWGTICCARQHDWDRIWRKFFILLFYDKSLCYWNARSLNWCLRDPWVQSLSVLFYVVRCHHMIGTTDKTLSLYISCHVQFFWKCFSCFLFSKGLDCSPDALRFWPNLVQHRLWFVRPQFLILWFLCQCHSQCLSP